MRIINVSTIRSNNGPNPQASSSRAYATLVPNSSSSSGIPSEHEGVALPNINLKELVYPLFYQVVITNNVELALYVESRPLVFLIDNEIARFDQLHHSTLTYTEASTGGCVVPSGKEMITPSPLLTAVTKIASPSRRILVTLYTLLTSRRSDCLTVGSILIHFSPCSASVLEAALNLDTLNTSYVFCPAGLIREQLVDFQSDLAGIPHREPHFSYPLLEGSLRCVQKNINRIYDVLVAY
jgi:hypothetical protein